MKVLALELSSDNAIWHIVPQLIQYLANFNEFFATKKVLERSAHWKHKIVPLCNM